MDNIIKSFMTSLNDIMLEKSVTIVGLGEDLGIDPSIIRRWCNKGKDVRLKTLIKLADYFQCSIGYLCGRVQENEGSGYGSEYQSFGTRLSTVMKEHDIKPFRLVHDLGITPSKYYYWRHGGEPSLTSLANIADYLNVSIDYLVGRHKN